MIALQQVIRMLRFHEIILLSRKSQRATNVPEIPASSTYANAKINENSLER
jgi:hypothetical protein